MKPKRILSFLLYIFVAIALVSATAPAEAKQTKSKTTQSSSKKNSSKKSGSSKKSSGKSSSSKKKSSSKKGTKKGSGSSSRKSGSKSGRNTSKHRGSSSGSKAAAAPKEVASNDSLTLLINEVLTSGIRPDINPGGLRVNLVKPDNGSHSVKVQLNESFTYLPVNRELISDFEKRVRENLPDSITDFRVTLNVGSKPYSYYISTIDKLPEQHRKNVPFVVPANPYVKATKGMEGDIVALWHSHGRYYKNGGWYWQRPFLFDTAEDIYTMSYVLPFLTPMLENAGAYVMLPRERDVNINEVIVDNDLNPEGEIYSQTTYREMNGSKKWETGELEGFIYDIPDFRDTENPFENGTYRQVETIRGGKQSVAGWFADIPEDGEYAVYVSYKSLPNSTEDAHYTVNYSGGTREYLVNQTMGGGTWIYLGTFPFRAGFNDQTPVVALSNQSEKGDKRIVTADAVKIGGGKGNIARSPRRSDVTWGTDVAEADENVLQPGDDEEEQTDDQGETEDEDEGIGDAGEESVVQTAQSKNSTTAKPAPRFTTSGLPRFLEGARYWLHWAGFPESVYSSNHGTDDYKDDYMSRGKWVNYLAGGSRVLPDRPGLNIPVDLSFALHTDAGKRSDDSFVGTLGIYYTDGGKTYPDGTPRNNSRILTDMIMRQVVGDIRRQYEPRWTRRSMWDKSYAEARSPEVPATLLELLSHQNFADMRYGLDPTFRFTVSRAIYKAMGRFIAERKGREFIVQPLPVDEFMITRDKKNTYRLSWQPVEDPLEPSAKPTKYIIMERTEGSMGFHKIGETNSTNFDIKVNDTKIHSVYVIAANQGGLSFPSETLAFKEGTGKPVLIINGFTRVSGPASFVSGGRAGFKADEDFGVPYLKDISFSGYQQEFSRGTGDRFGSSGSNHVATVAGGNTFDYPAVHGAAIASTGRGFVSCSLKAVEEGKVKLGDYSIVDLILGKQKRTTIGSSTIGPRFDAFPKVLQKKLTEFVEKRGNLIVSGQNIASELYSENAPEGSREFAQEILGIDSSTTSNTRTGKVKVKNIDRHRLDDEVMAYSSTLRKDHYIIESADALTPFDEREATPFLTFTDTGDVAGLMIDRGRNKVAVMTIPLETYLDSYQTGLLMKSILSEFGD